MQSDQTPQEGPEKPWRTAKVQLEKEMHLELPPMPTITRMRLVPRLENGYIVFDIFAPDGSAIAHKRKSPPQPPATT